MNDVTLSDVESAFLWKILAVVTLAFALIRVVGAATPLLLVIFGGVVVGTYFSGLAWGLTHRTPLGYRASVGVVYVAHLALIAAVVPWWLSQGQPQAERLVRELPEAFAQLSAQLQDTSWGTWIIRRLPSPSEILAAGDGGVVLGMKRFLRGAGGVVTAAAVLIFVGIYVGAAPDIYRRGLLRLFRIERRERMAEVLDRAATTMRMWVWGRMIGALVIGGGVALGLWLLEVPLPLMLGLLAGVLTFIPNFGPAASVVPPALLALTQSPERVLYVFALFAGLQIIESYFLTPMIQERAVEVPPALLLSTQIVMGVLVGLVGLALAAPLTAVVLVLVKELYVVDELGDRDGDEDDSSFTDAIPSGEQEPAEAAE